MTESLVAFLYSIIPNERVLVFVLSVIPLFEARGAVLIGVELGLANYQSWLFAFLGSSLSVIPLFFLLCPLLKLLKRLKPFRRLADCINSDCEQKADSLRRKSQTKKRNIYFALFLFVAVPLPLTGIWSGTAIAAFLGLEAKKTLSSVIAGNFVASGLVTALTLLFPTSVGYILSSFIYLAIALTIGYVTFKIVKQKKTKIKQTATQEPKTDSNQKGLS